MRPTRLTIRMRLTLIFTGLSAFCVAIMIALSYTLIAQLGPAVKRPPDEAGSTSSANSSTTLKSCQQEQNRPNPDHQKLKRCNEAFQSQGAGKQRTLILSHLLEYSLIIMGITVGLSGWFGWIFAGRILRPVHRITAAARTASEQNLSARVALTGPRDELRELAETFDSMLDRLQVAFESQQRFIADASHELRTPLAVMRTTLDVVLDDPNSTPEDLREMAADVRTDISRAEHLITALLLLARNDGGLKVHDDVDLATVAEDVLDAIDPGDRQLHPSLDPAVISGDRVLAEHLIANLVENAIRYNVPGGDIWIRTRTTDGAPEVVVTNDGPKIPTRDVHRIFEPFHRLSERTTHDGSGLGLAIVASIAKIHGGSVNATAREQGGLSVRVTMPSEGSN